MGHGHDQRACGRARGEGNKTRPAPTDPAATPTSGGTDYPPSQTDTHETMTIDAVQNRRRDTQHGAQHARNGVQSATCPPNLNMQTLPKHMA